MFLEKLYWKNYQVVKVNGIVKLESFLVTFVQLAVHVVFIVPLLASCFYVAEKNAYFV